MEHVLAGWHAGIGCLEGMTLTGKTGETATRDTATNGQRPPGAPGQQLAPQPGWRRPGARIAHAYQHTLSTRQRSAFVSWASFTATFGAVRGVTYAIKHHIPPFHNIELGNTHLHHYVWGIGLICGAGGVAVYGDGDVRCHPVVGVVYGAGMALVVDELALLLELRDVYWQRQGRWSFDAGAGMIGTAGAYFAAMPFWHHLLRKQPQEHRGDTGLVPLG
jgi:hypothetical protein